MIIDEILEMMDDILDDAGTVPFNSKKGSIDIEKMRSCIRDIKNITTVVNHGTREEKTILNDLSLKIEDGDFITLLGTNGAGKSTLLNVINGSLRPTSGQILLDQKDLTPLSEVKRATYISQVFQDPKLGTAPRMTVAENLLLADKRGQKRGLRPRHLKEQQIGRAHV